MVKIELMSVEKNDPRTELWQWDLDRQVKIRTTEAITRVDFAQEGVEPALPVDVEEFDGYFIANVPNIQLQETKNITVYVKKDGATIRSWKYPIVKREKPADYVYTETQVRTVEQLAEKLDQDIQERMSTVAEEVRGMVKDGEDGQDGQDGQDGADGFSPIAKVEKTVDGAKITVTDKNGITEAIVKNGKDGADGKDGNPLQFAIKPTTDPATSLHIQDSAKYRVLDIGMQGKTEQYTTTGKNLFDYDAYIAQGKTIRLDVEANKVLYRNAELGMITNWGVYDAENNLIGTFEDYKFTASKPLTLPVNASYIYASNDDVSKTFYIGYDSDTTYEPYTGGIPSPNTDFPQEIRHAGRYNEETGRYEVDVEVCNKNFYKPTIFSTHQCTARLEKDKYIFENTETTGVVVVKNELLTLKKGITYRLSLHDVVNVDRVIVWENGDVNKPLGDARATYTFTCTPTENMKIRCGIYMKDISIIGNVAECRIQIEQGTTTTPYIPHESQKVTLTPPRPFTKWDDFKKVDGWYYWEFKSKKYVFNGSMWLRYDTFNGFTLPNGLTEKSNRQEGYCNQAKVIPSNTSGTMAPPNVLWLGVSNNTALYLVNNDFYDDTLEDKGLANFKAHLNENPLEIWTYSDTSELIPVSDEEQAALEALETYYGVTNISNSEECEMSIQYVADTKLYVDNKFTALATQIV